MGRPKKKRGGPLCLSYVEQEILYYAMDGLNYHQMAERLRMTHRTVSTYRTVLIHKLGAVNITGAVINAIRMNLVDLWSERPISGRLEIPETLTTEA